MNRQTLIDTLVKHSWMGTLKTCACLYGKHEPALHTHSAHAEHVADIIIERALTEALTPEKCCAGGPQWGHAWDCKTLP